MFVAVIICVVCLIVAIGIDAQGVRQQRVREVREAFCLGDALFCSVPWESWRAVTDEDWLQGRLGQNGPTLLRRGGVEQIILAEYEGVVCLVDPLGVGSAGAPGHRSVPFRWTPEQVREVRECVFGPAPDVRIRAWLTESEEKKP